MSIRVGSCFFVTLLDQFYWCASATLGGLVGSLLSFDTTGISFVMTAMFVVIFIEQWLKEDSHISSLIGILGALSCLLIFGPNSFMLPTMIVIILSLILFRNKIEVAK